MVEKETSCKNNAVTIAAFTNNHSIALCITCNAFCEYIQIRQFNKSNWKNDMHIHCDFMVVCLSQT